MSIIATVYLRECIVMAADSRITGTTKHPDDHIDRHSLSDSGQKVFLLKDHSIGISTAGAQDLDGKTIADFIRSFELDEVKPEDSIKDVASKLCEYAKGKYKGSLIFHICGYQAGIKTVIRIVNDKIEVEVDEKNVDLCGAIWNGEPKVLSLLLTGENAIPIEWNFMYMKDGIDFAEFLVDVTCKIHRFQSGLATCGGPIDILLLTKDYARWIKHKVLNP